MFVTFYSTRLYLHVTLYEFNILRINYTVNTLLRIPRHSGHFSIRFDEPNYINRSPFWCGLTRIFFKYQGHGGSRIYNYGRSSKKSVILVVKFSRKTR